MRRSKRQANADFSSGARHAGLWQFADVDLWRRTCGAVLNEVRRVLIVFSKLAVNGAFREPPTIAAAMKSSTRAAAPKATRRTISTFNLQARGYNCAEGSPVPLTLDQLRVTSSSMRTAMIFISRSGALFRTSALAFPSVLVKGNPDAVGLSLCAARGNVRDRRKPASCSSITRVQ